MNYAKPFSLIVISILILSGFSFFSIITGDNTTPAQSTSYGEDIDKKAIEILESTNTRSARYIDKDFSAADAQLTLVGGSAGDYTGNDLYGQQLAFGDIDDDGYDDLIVGVPYGDGSSEAPRDNSGEVVVKFGNPDQTNPGTIHDIAEGDYDMIIYGRTATASWGQDAGDILGFSVATGDINGDGYDDIVMGAIGGQMNTNRRDAGAVYVLYGDKRENLPGSIDLAQGLDFAIFGAYWETLLGRSVATGDLNKDGYDDIIVGEPFGDPNGRTNAGNVYVVFGGSNLGASEDLWRGAISASTIVIIGDKPRTGNSDPGDRAGTSLACGDINGDQFDDLIIGAASGQRGSGRLNAGAVYVILGATSMSTRINLTNEARVNIWGDDRDDYAGMSLASGDIDGDNIDDILIGAPYGDGQGNSGTNRGEMYIVYGSTSMAQNIDLATTYGLAVWAKNDWDYLGTGIAVGDLNGDDYGDFVVGSRLDDTLTGDIADAGAAYIFHGDTRSGLGSSLDTKNDAAGQIFGAGASDILGYSVSFGDYDSDDIDDLAVLSRFADGPLDARDTCGEIYLIYGQAPPAKINSVELLDSNGEPIDTIYSMYEPYTFRVNVTNILGTADLSEVVLNLDPKALDNNGADLEYKWNIGGSKFTEIKDTKDHTKLLSIAGSAVQQGLYSWELDFELEFDWEFPRSGKLPVTVTAVGTRSLEATKTFTDVFEVEDDLELAGTLVVWDEEGSQVGEGGWIAGGETISFTGLIPVYEGTTDVYPPDNEFTVEVIDKSSTWTNTTMSGSPIHINATVKTVTDLLSPFTVTIASPPSESLRSSKVINLSIDGEMPQPPSRIEFKKDLISSPALTAVNTTDFLIEWDLGDDKFSGIRGYYYSLENNEGTGEGTYTPDTNALITDASEGTVRVFIWSVDNAGNIGKSVSSSVIVDLDNIKFEDFEPTPGDWVLSKNFNCTIVIDDGSGSGIDISSIRYKISTRGISQYESWQSVDDIDVISDDYVEVTVDINDDFDEGSENYIRFKAADIASNNLESSDFNIKLDASPVEFKDEEPSFSSKQEDTLVEFYITIVDMVSKVDLSSIQYAYSTNGISGYGNWLKENMLMVSDEEYEGYGVKYRIDLELQPGKSNYLKWRAKDFAGNGFTESEDYRIWVNSPPQIKIDGPEADSKFTVNKEIKFSAAGTVDNDNDTLSYKWRSSIDGEFGFAREVTSKKLSEGTHEITLEVSDGISTQTTKISIKVEPEKGGLLGTSISGVSTAVDLTIIIVLIIVLFIIFFLFLRNRKKLKETEEKAKRVSAELMPLGAPGTAPGMPPGVAAQQTGYGLESGFGRPAQPSYPQLPGTGGAQPPMPTYDYGVSPGAAPGTPIVTGIPEPQAPDTAQGQVAPAFPQLPPAVSAEYPHLSGKEKMELLEEKFLTGQISENLYMQLKEKYSQELTAEPGFETPPAVEGPSVTAPTEPVPQVPVTPPPVTKTDDFSFKAPSTYPEQVAPTPQEPIITPPTPQVQGPSGPATEWRKEEDVLSKIQIPGGEEVKKPVRKIKKIKKR
jgi:uncharacterized membrane protein